MKIKSRLGLAAISVLGLSVVGGLGAGVVPALAGSGTGSIQLTVVDPSGFLVNGYCLSASGASKFVTAPSGTDGNTGEIVQANVNAGSYKAVIYDCGGGQGYSSQGQLSFGVTANIQNSLGQFQLENGGSVYGQVLDAATGVGAPDVSVTAYDPSKQIEISGGGCTDADGNWSFGGLPTSGVKIEFGGGSCGNDDAYAAQWYDGASSFKTATVIDPLAACCGTPANTVTLTDKTTSKNGKVSITSVTISGSSESPEFVVAGSGFGSGPGKGAAPGCTEIAGAGLNYGSKIFFNDNSSNQWQAGTGSDCIGLVIVSWSDTSIVFDLGSWYSWSGGGAGQGTVLNAGDPYTMTVKGAHLTGIVSIS
ncbi:MAG: hypothetical protein ABSH30_10640 [Acidimicrobiales bacterium]|jgi:hypothetical protein